MSEEEKVVASLQGGKGQGHEGFWHELMDELRVLEGRTAQWVLQAADPSAQDYQRLQSCFQMSENIRQAHEVAEDENLTCLGCGQHYFARGIITVVPCEHCGGGFFAVEASH